VRKPRRIWSAVPMRRRRLRLVFRTVLDRKADKLLTLSALHLFFLRGDSSGALAMSTKSLAICPAPLAAKLAASEASAADVVVTISGAREAGQQPKVQPKTAGTALELRAIFWGIMPSWRPCYQKGQPDVTGALPGRPQQPRGAANNIRHTLCAPSGWEGALSVRLCTSYRLRVVLAP